MKNYLMGLGIASMAMLPVFADYDESKWKELNLTPEQKTKVMSIKEKHKEEMNRDIEAVLNADQKTKFQQIKAEQKAKWQEKKQEKMNEK
ncbi:MAG: hypothetical protein SFU25_11390 [Candidatus Caenarcaniphilales bacterium]|nr:hypothetical protein [Candidatus Caenarcaniphilales bacterium]